MEKKVKIGDKVYSEGLSKLIVTVTGFTKDGDIITDEEDFHDDLGDSYFVIYKENVKIAHEDDFRCGDTGNQCNCKSKSECGYVSVQSQLLSSQDEVYEVYKGYAIRYSKSDRLVEVEDFGRIIKTFEGQDCIPGVIQAMNFVDTLYPIQLS